MLHRQAPQHICTSTHSVVVTTPPQPNGPGIHAFTGDHYTLDLPSTSTTTTVNAATTAATSNFLKPTLSSNIATNSNKVILNKTPLRLAEQYHDQHTITHLVWNQKGTTLASADETGRIALWILGNSSDNWTMAYSVNLHQPPAALLWLNTDRLYDIPLADQTQQEKFVREPLVGPRNIYGYFAFVAVTVHGEVSVHYQQGRKIFSQFSTMLPQTGHNGQNRADIGCFGMDLSNSGKWFRISHASMTFDHDGSLLLAAQQANIKPNAIHLYRIRLRFPGRANEGAIFCQSIAKLILSAQSLASTLGDFTKGVFGVSQILLLRKQSGIELAVAFANADSGSGFFSKWALQLKTEKVAGDVIASDNFSGTVMVSERLSLEYVSGFSIPNRFVTSISGTRYAGIVLGLSDGSVHIEFRDDRYPGVARSRSNSGQLEESIGTDFWQAGPPRTYRDNDDPDAVAGLTMSPNETHVISILYSGRLAVIRITNTDSSNSNHSDQLSMISKLLKLTLLNQSDDLDLISELVRLSQLPGMKENTAEDIISNAMLSYQVYCIQNRIDDVLISPKPDTLSGIRDWNLPQQGRAYGLALGTCRRLSSTNIQYVNLSKAIQLPIILECFVGSCRSDYATVSKMLNDLKISEEGKSLEFEADSLWSLISLTTWTLDFVRWILRKWNTLFNCKRPKSSKFADISARPSHAVLLYHKESRLALCKILVMVFEFVRFTRSSSYELQHLPESMPLLQKYASNVLKSEPVSLQDMLAFLKALDGADDDDDKQPRNSWDLLLHSRLPSDKIDKLRKITTEFAEKCAQPAIYLERDTDDTIDVIQKRRIPSTAKHVWRCVRCQQHAMAGISSTDPCSYALWYRSLQRRCICGGLFTNVPFRQASRSSYS
ncbi:hypothetical protein BDB00DRAFT_840113 [Zychaea mexicana]|uniref:uncharacterized protein n=1 Tax=Zychaea mexicana TaxID=64656 RepID=UPI0022FEEE98|nr:uncharacterized protein BDB00DRAFT_840113 [Zychaea mexicana]KAI9489933.1 hypothetical protein BDB00DRAFT_840113 [Zychaea mexicana]